MSLFAELIISTAVCFAIFLPLNAVRLKLRCSAPPCGDVETELVVRAAGAAESLEYAVGAALRELPRAPFILRVTIEDGGLNSEAREVAELLCRENEQVYIRESPERAAL